MGKDFTPGVERDEKYLHRGGLALGAAGCEVPVEIGGANVQRVGARRGSFRRKSDAVEGDGSRGGVVEVVADGVAGERDVRGGGVVAIVGGGGEPGAEADDLDFAEPA